ncbi:MAG: hypothetical protein M3Z00_09590 [Actinomycetota bacterium]|nr:hypothetical protein [Actinomycetota bacterium]
MSSEDNAARRSVVRRLVDAPTGPADLATLAKRRRIAHLIAVALLLVLIVALSASPGDGTQHHTSAANVIGGFSAILLLIFAAVGVQYSVRIARLRKAGRARRSAPDRRPAVLPTSSAAYQPIQQLRSAQLRLQSALPDIEPVREGIGATAEQTRSALEKTGRRVLLQEQVLATLEDSADPDKRRIADMRRALDSMTARLQSGVDRYLNLAQQASLTATSLGDMNAGEDLQYATDQLAGLDQGLHQVQQISGDYS